MTNNRTGKKGITLRYFFFVLHSLSTNVYTDLFVFDENVFNIDKQGGHPIISTERN